MFTESLPLRVEPYKLASQQALLKGGVLLAKMPRLASYLCDDDGAIEVELSFGVDPQGHRTVTGSARGVVRVACQRCLEAMEIALETEFQWALASSDEAAKSLPRCYDPLVVIDELLELGEAIEDELILSLPLVSYHEPDQCAVDADALSSGTPETAAEPEEKSNPFSVLAKLKADK